MSSRCRTWTHAISAHNVSSIGCRSKSFTESSNRAVMPEQTRSSGGAGVGGTYGPAQQQSNSGNAADPSDPKPHITRSSGGAGVEGTYGPDDASVKAIVDSSKQTPAKQQSPEGQDAGLKAEANLPDAMVAPDDGSLAHESGANVQGRIDVGAAVGGVRSKL